MPRVKQFDDLIEEHPDFMTLRNHIAKTVAGDGKKVMLMAALWRVIRAACQLSQKIPYAKKEPEPEPVSVAADDHATHVRAAQEQEAARGQEKGTE